MQARVMAAPVAQADIHIVLAKIDHALHGIDADLGAGVALTERLEPGYQPLDRERRGHADRERPRRLGAAQPRHRSGQAIEALADPGERALARLGEQQPLRPALKQPHPQVLLERLELMADGGRRHVQLVRRLGKTQMAPRGLERAQAVQRR